MSRKKHGASYITDDTTDKMFYPYFNEEKFNEQLRGEFNDELEKKVEHRSNPKLSGRITDSEHKKNTFSKSATKSDFKHTKSDRGFGSKARDGSERKFIPSSTSEE